jgi:hypothetical protein
MTSIATITANWYVRYREAVQLDESSIRRPEMPEARGGQANIEAGTPRKNWPKNSCGQSLAVNADPKVR